MSKEEVIDVNSAENQIVKLLEAYKDLKVKHVQLKCELEKTLAELDDARLKITELNANYNRLKLAKAYGWDENSKREAHNRITRLVRDIDKCLELLNEID